MDDQFGQSKWEYCFYNLNKNYDIHAIFISINMHNMYKETVHSFVLKQFECMVALHKKVFTCHPNIIKYLLYWFKTLNTLFKKKNHYELGNIVIFWIAIFLLK